MTVHLMIQPKGWDETIAALGKYDQVVSRENHKAMNKSVLLVERVGKQEAPMGATGHLKSSLVHLVEKAGIGQVVGTVGTHIGYGPAVELGTPPHNPNVKNLRYWVERKLGLKGRDAARVTFLVGRKIRRAGTKAQPFLDPAFTGNQEKIEGYFEQALDNIVNELAEEK